MLARAPGILHVLENPAVVGHWLNVPGDKPGIGKFPNGVTDTNSDCVFNKHDVFADTQHIGIIEEKYTGFWRSHVSLSLSSNGIPDVVTEHEPLGCTPLPAGTPGFAGGHEAKECYLKGNLGFYDPNCGLLCALADTEVCLPSTDTMGATATCVAEHSDQVLTAMALTAVDSTRPDVTVPYGAAAALYLFPNKGLNWNDDQPINCNSANTAHAVDYLVENLANRVSESFSCAGAPFAGVIEDYYSRHAGVTFFQAGEIILGIK